MIDCATIEIADPLSKEHCYAMNLLSAESATNTASKSGMWSDNNVWGGDVPASGSTVLIPKGVEVTVDEISEVSLEGVRVEGSLTFSKNNDTKLKVGTLITAPDSLIRLGSQDAPIDADVSATIEIADLGPIDLGSDPEQLGRGIIAHGAVEIFGAPKTSWVELYSGGQTGSSTLHLGSAPEGWRPGDRLVVAGTSPDGSGEEEVTIASVNGSTVKTEQPLQLDHTAPRDDLAVHVGNLTRNVAVQSESTQIETSRARHVHAHARRDD